MEIYYSGCPAEITKKYNTVTGKKLNVLISFYNQIGRVKDTVESYGESVNKIMLDSGAFSTFNNKEELLTTKNRFEMFLKYNDKEWLQETFSRIFTFDAYLEKDKFDENVNIYSELSKYTEVVPVIHDIDDDFKEIEVYNEMGADMIAIGKLEFEKTPEKINRAIDKIHSLGKKCHVLGVSNMDVVSKCNFESCDSTSWLKYAISGEMFYFRHDKDTPKMYTIYFPENEKDSKDGTINWMDFDKKVITKDLQSALKMKIRELTGRNRIQARQLVNILYTERMLGFYEKLKKIN